MGFIIDIGKAIIKGVTKIIGAVVKIAGGIFGFSVGGKTADEATPPNTLNKSIEPEAPRKIVFGRIAAPLDVRYWEVHGTGGKHFDEIIALAGHKITSILELYIEDDLAINAAGIVQTKFAGVLARHTRTGIDNQTAYTVAGAGVKWNATATMDGIPSILLKWVPDEKKLPNGIPSRYTQIVEGMPVYDPRRDSTQPGGSGAHRANDVNTWEYLPLDGNGQPIGRNNALQSLGYILGWKVLAKSAAGATLPDRILVCGRGVLPEDINMATFIAGANNCEVAGYYTDLVLSTEDSHVSNENAITASGLIGRLIDPGGLWSYYANVNDTANIAVELTDADILEGSSISWDEFKGMSEQYNQVVGKYINPSSTTLFQAFPYPMVRDATYEANLGIKKRKPLNFRQILDAVLAQRLARLFLNEGQYQGEFKAGFNYKAIKAQAYSVVRYTSERFGWTKLFRVWRYELSTRNGVSMLLKEIDASIWTAGTTQNAFAYDVGTNYDPLTEYSVADLLATEYSIVGVDGTLGDGFKLAWTAPPIQVRKTETRYRLNGTVDWVSSGVLERDETSVMVAPLFSGAIYDIQARHISIHDIAGPWIDAGPFQMGTTGNVNLAAIEAAGGTADWANVTGYGRPDDFADITGENVAGGITGQGPGATAPGSNVLNEYISGTTIRSLFFNPYFDLVQPNSVPLRPQGIIATNTIGTSLVNNTIGYENNIAGGNLAMGVGVFQDTRYFLPMWRCNIRAKYRVRGKVKSSANVGDGFYVRFYEYDGEPAPNITHIGFANNNNIQEKTRVITGVGKEIVNQPLTTSFVDFVVETSPTSTAKYMSLELRRYGSNGIVEFYISELIIEELLPTSVYEYDYTGELDATDGAVIGGNLTTGGGTIPTPNEIITLDGIAGGFIDQGVLATRDTIDFDGDAGSVLINFGDLGGFDYVRPGAGGGLRRSNGTTDILDDNEIITSLGTASGFAGQGALATRADVLWETHVSGRPTELIDGRIGAGLTAAGDIARNIPSGIRAASNILERVGGGLFTGELAATVGGFFGGNIRETSGGIIATISNYRTANGTAAGIVGQGLLATANEVNEFTIREGLLGTNLIADPDFSNITSSGNGQASWWIDTARVTIDTTNPLVTAAAPNGLGAKSALKTIVNGANGYIAYMPGTQFKSYLRVQENAWYQLSVPYYASAGYTGAPRVMFQWYDVAGAVIGGLNQLYGNDHTSVANSAEYFSQLFLEFQSPQGAAYLRVYFWESRSSTLTNAGFALLAKPSIQAIWPNIQRPLNNAGTSLTLNKLGAQASNTLVRANSFYRNTNGDDNSASVAVISAENFTGGAVVSFQPFSTKATADFNTVVGFTAVSNPTSVADVEFGARAYKIGATNVIYVYANASGAIISNSVSETDTITVAYDGVKGYIFQNGTLIHSRNLAANKRYYFIGSTTRGYGGATNILFMPYNAASRLGTNVFNAAGTVVQGDIDLITGQGIASSIASQGVFATLNSVSALDNTRITDGPAEAGADITGAITGSAVVSIKYQSDGVTAETGELSKTIYYKNIKNGIDVTTASTWSRAVISGSISTTIGSANGVLSIASLSSNEAVVRITAVNAGRTRTFDVKITKQIAAISSTGGGTSTSGTVASDTTLAAITSTNSASPTLISDEITVILGSAITSAKCVANIDVNGSTNSVYGKVQWWNGSAWVDVNSYVAASPQPVSTFEAGYGTTHESGIIAFTVSKTGLTAGSTHKFRFVGYKSGGGTINSTGSCTVKGDGT